MITVIIAGGSGTRLWPLSTSDYPKHLLNLTGDRTLLQMAYDRSRSVGDTIYIVTEQSHSDHVKSQLPDLPQDAVLIEPGRRGTAHCIVMALDVIARTGNKDEPIAFIHSDHFVRDVEGFARSVHAAGRVSSDKNEITLVGIEPTFPATGFGYIERDGVIDEGSGAFRVASFKEKPDLETAQTFLASGNYLWNCGYFVGSVNTFWNEINASAPELQASVEKLRSVTDYPSDDYNNAYLALDTQIIDYALSERSNNLAVVAATFDWMDIGSFKDLHDIVDKDERGNYQRGENIHSLDNENVYIRNEEAKPIAVIGLDNVVVVNTPDGILVARKDVSQRTGEVAKSLSRNR
ncbi:mannose-1-phosphate guanyltransferase [Patescibacteria group bacterium]|nr:MAG: mannose-1-phosphate guanyltransferase [Patescibacteria group bacterium]